MKNKNDFLRNIFLTPIAFFVFKEEVIFVFFMMIMKKVMKAVSDYCGIDDDYEIIDGVDEGS